MTISYVLTTACSDKQGIVAAISGFLADSGCSVDDAAFFDPESERFSGRSVFRIDRNDVNAEMVGSWFGQVAHKFDIEWDIFDTSVPKKVVIMVSKFDHCLNDLLYRALPMEVAAIADGGHRDCLRLDRGNWHPVGMHSLSDADAAVINIHHSFRQPITISLFRRTPKWITRPCREARLYALIEGTGTDLVVLAYKLIAGFAGAVGRPARKLVYFMTDG